MTEKESKALDNKSYFAEVVPFFEETKAKLISVFYDDPEWQNFLSNLHLVFIDNSQHARQSHLYLTNEVNDNLCVVDSEPLHQHYGYRSKSFGKDYVYLNVLGTLRYVFLERLLASATPIQISDYIKRILETNYRFVNQINNLDYIHFQVPNIQFSGNKPLFAFSAYRVNMVIPFVDQLDGQNIIDETADNVKVLLTNRKSLEGYRNFDHILGLSHFTIHFDTMEFISGSYLYQQILARSYSDIFTIMNILRTSGKSEIFELKKRLVDLNPSDGKAFEAYLHEFLSICLGSEFEEIIIKTQVPNKSRLRIRDFVIVNNSSKSSFLRSLKAKGIDLLLFDAKNYAKELSTRDLDTFKEYLAENDHFGDLGVILSRNGVSANASESIFRALSRGTRILVLDEGDLLSMLEHIDVGKSAIDVLESKYYELLLQL